VGKIFYQAFDILSDGLRSSLNDHRARYLAALRDGSENILRLMNSWQGHFENAINGANTVEALEQLQKLPAPTPKLASKLAVKLATRRGTVAHAARRSSRENTSQALASNQALTA
jgi:hypothetical protein